MTILIPVNISFVAWANELRNSFPDQNIPIVVNENEWKSFVNTLLYNACFKEKNIPYVVGFNNWRDWASEFMLSIGA